MKNKTCYQCQASFVPETRTQDDNDICGECLNKLNGGIEMTQQKILKIKVGEVYFDGKTHMVTQTAFEKKSKKGQTYYETRNPVFVQVIEKKESVKQEQIEA